MIARFEPRPRIAEKYRANEQLAKYRTGITGINHDLRYAEDIGIMALAAKVQGKKKKTECKARQAMSAMNATVAAVLSKCEVLKQAGLWLPEPHIRPRAWIENFDQTDMVTAAALLDRFTFYNARLTDRLLVAAYECIGDGLPKGPQAPDRLRLLDSLRTAIVAPVEGEQPNPSDSGNFLCRKARQLLSLPESSIVTTEDALSHASQGGTIVFVDDFIGSGDQFLSTWTRSIGGRSFESINIHAPFTCIYVALVATEIGAQRIHLTAPTIALCVAHELKESSTVRGFKAPHATQIDAFLQKYAQKLCPSEAYMTQNEAFLRLGYKEHGILFAFEHSVPDATLPIFWSKGINQWEPLIERH